MAYLTSHGDAQAIWLFKSYKTQQLHYNPNKESTSSRKCTELIGDQKATTSTKVFLFVWIRSHNQSTQTTAKSSDQKALDH